MDILPHNGWNLRLKDRIHGLCEIEVEGELQQERCAELKGSDCWVSPQSRRGGESA